MKSLCLHLKTISIITWFHAAVLIKNTEQYWTSGEKLQANINTVDTRKHCSIFRSFFCKSNWSKKGVVGEVKDLVAKSFRTGESGTTTEMKPEQLFAVDLCFNDDDRNSKVCSYSTVQNKLYVAQMSARSTLKQPCSHYGWSSTMNNYEAVSLADRMCCFQQNTQTSSTRSDQVLFRSFPHSYQGRDLPFLESCLSTSLMDLQRK